MSKREILWEELLREELLRLANVHLPYARKSLKELLSEKYPHVVCRDGTIHMFRRRELEFLKTILTEDEWDKVLLPIIIELNPSYGEGAAVVRGEMEVKVVAKVLGLDIKEGVKEIIIYRPQIGVLREKLRTVTQIAFSLKSIMA